MRVAGAATLADLAKKDPKNYDATVMKAFETFLTYPPKFSGPLGRHKKGEIDYHSRDTQEIVKAINARTQKQRARYRIQLPLRAPFLVTDNDDVKADPMHPDFDKWATAEGTPPSYEKQGHRSR